MHRPGSPPVLEPVADPEEELLLVLLEFVVDKIVMQKSFVPLIPELVPLFEEIVLIVAVEIVVFED